MRRWLIAILLILIASGGFAVRAFPQVAQTPPTTQTPAAAPPATIPPPPPPENPPHTLAVAVIDPAHGGADAGARGTAGIVESDLVLSFARLLRISLEAQGLRVILTRQGNEDPSFDDRSQKANGQRGAIFITLHISSTGPPGTVRVYSLGKEVAPDAPVIPSPERVQLLAWDSAQQMYLGTSGKLAALVQTEMTQRFPGSPDMPALAAVRQLRTVAAPAIAVEVSSVSVPDRTTLDRMAPILADGIAHGVVAFRPIYASGTN